MATGLCADKFCNLRSSGRAHIAFHDQLTSDSSLSMQMIGWETVNSEGDRADLEGQKLPPAFAPISGMPYLQYLGLDGG